MQIDKIEAAEGIRGLAVLIVIVLHSIGLFYNSMNPLLTGTGQYGVWIFFVLSAFLLSNKFLHRGFGVKELTGYVIGRTIRILPIFWICILAYWKMDMISLEKAVNIMTFKEQFIHFWTIPVEFKFYFILPFIVFAANAIQSRFGLYCSLAFLALCVIAQRILLKEFNSAAWRDFQHIPIFIYGIAIAMTMKAGAIRLTPIVSDIIATFVFAVMVIMSPAMLKLLFDIPPAPRIQGMYTTLGFGMAIFVMVTLPGKGIWGDILKSTPLKLLGKWSFSIYLFHWMVIWQISPHRPNHFYAMLLCIIESIAVGAFIYHAVESPIERARHFLMSLLFRARDGSTVKAT